jgi:hypothetical protein
MTYKYWVDFESWSIEANSEEEAQRIAEEKMKGGEYPAVTDVELQEY